MIKPYLLHPAFVHFPIALLTVGAGTAAVARARAWSWSAGAASWLLWLGTASAAVAAGLGWLAERTAPHVPSAWEAMSDHRTLGLWTVGVFAALSLWRRLLPERWPSLFLAAWLAATVLLAAAAREGGELVYAHNMGTAASEP